MLSKISINERSYQKHKTVVTMIRREVRKKLGHLKNFSSLTSFDDHQLDETLVNVKYISVENYENYKN